VEQVKITKVGDAFMITGSDKAAVEAAAAELQKKGARLLSQAEPIGSKWVMTCEDPKDRRKECQVIKLGMQLMIKGPTQQVVSIKASELVRAGARLISPPSEATGGGWVAVCDDVEQIHKW
jgi:predicted enzyme related to lactoylglutathione lyase